MNDFDEWIKLRASSVDESGDKLCYCGHTDMCSCSDPNKKLFEESVERGVLNPCDPKNGWHEADMTKNDKAITECYRMLFYKSEPSADFEELVKNADTNEQGQKIIDFMAYEIDEEVYGEIVDYIIKKYKFNGIKKQQFKTTIALGCSPKFKRKDK